jgi:hypothetical protein
VVWVRDTRYEYKCECGVSGTSVVVSMSVVVGYECGGEYECGGGIRVWWSGLLLR